MLQGVRAACAARVAIGFIGCGRLGWRVLHWAGACACAIAAPVSSRAGAVHPMAHFIAHFMARLMTAAQLSFRVSFLIISSYLPQPEAFVKAWVVGGADLSLLLITSWLSIY